MNSASSRSGLAHRIHGLRKIEKRYERGEKNAIKIGEQSKSPVVFRNQVAIATSLRMKALSLHQKIGMLRLQGQHTPKDPGLEAARTRYKSMRESGMSKREAMNSSRLGFILKKRATGTGGGNPYHDERGRFTHK